MKNKSNYWPTRPDPAIPVGERVELVEIVPSGTGDLDPRFTDRHGKPGRSCRKSLGFGKVAEFKGARYAITAIYTILMDSGETRIVPRRVPDRNSGFPQIVVQKVLLEKKEIE